MNKTFRPSLKAPAIVFAVILWPTPIYMIYKSVLDSRIELLGYAGAIFLVYFIIVGWIYSYRIIFTKNEMVYRNPLFFKTVIRLDEISRVDAHLFVGKHPVRIAIYKSTNDSDYVSDLCIDSRAISLEDIRSIVELASSDSANQNPNF